MTEVLIQAVDVLRDPVSGWWRHPDLPEQQPDDQGAFDAWMKGQLLRYDYVLMQDDPAVSDSHPYWALTESNCVGWEPSPPVDAGPDAFLLSIFDTEEGPAALWVWRVAPIRLPEGEMGFRKFGRVVVTPQGITVEGFDVENAMCRDTAIMAAAWAIGELQREMLKTIEKPGGGKIGVG